MICELRRNYPRRGPRRLGHELAHAGVTPVPSFAVGVRATGVARLQHRTEDSPREIADVAARHGSTTEPARSCSLRMTVQVTMAESR